jgi:flagellar basal body P-ring formation protein FlgA
VEARARGGQIATQVAAEAPGLSIRFESRPPAARFCRRMARDAAPRLPGRHLSSIDGTTLAYSVIPMRIAPKFRRGKLIRHCALAALALAPALAGAEISDPEDIAHLEALAKSEAALEFPKLTDRQRFQVGPIERHLQFDKCSRPLRPVVASPQHMKDRVMIELRCQDPKPWHLYVPVRIVATSPVAVAAHAIVAGTVVKATDLKVEEHDVSELPLGFLDDPAIAVGLTAGRPIAGGAYLTNQELAAPKVVQRGQSVTLLADAGGISVRMAGRAMSDGLMNQRVKVQNLSSGKIVEGIARSEQVVEIILQ